MVTDNNFVHRVFAGIDSESSEYKLAPKEVFTTPKLALTCLLYTSDAADD